MSSTAARISCLSLSGIDRPGGALEPADRGVAVQGHDQDVAQFLGLLEKTDMPGVDQVEAAVREDDRPAVLAQPFPDAASAAEASDLAGSLHPPFPRRLDLDAPAKSSSCAAAG